MANKAMTWIDPRGGTEAVRRQGRRRPRAYLAHPMTAYGTDHEAACLGELARLLTGWDLVDPAVRYASSAGWLRAWPRLVPTLSAVVVFADESGTIASGCLRELADAVTAMIPVVAFKPEVGLIELIGVQLVDPLERVPQRAGSLVLGGHVDPSRLPLAMRQA
jgi:hypothetical protein